MNDRKKSTKKPSAVRLFSIIGIACALLLFFSLIFINMGFSRLPHMFTEIDISGTGLFSLDERTEAVVAGLNSDVDIYWIVQSGNENSEIDVLLKRYADLSGHIRISKIDPVVNPSFAEAYTDKIVQDNSIIVATGGRSRYIDYDDIFAANSNYFSDIGTSTDFNGESLITSAIRYVSDGRMPKLYLIDGHNEDFLPTALEALISNENFITEKLSLIGKDSVPDDADALIMVSPKTAITEAEGKLLSNYLSEGGRIVLFTDYGYTNDEALASILEDYGMEAVDGLVLEGDPYRCYGGYPMQILPVINYHDITSPIISGGYSVLASMSHGILVKDEPQTSVTVSGLLSSTADSYAKTGNIDTLYKEENDIEGPFFLGAAAEMGSGEGASRILWFGTSELLEPDYDSLVNGSNYNLILNSLQWITGGESSINISSKQISSFRLTVPDGGATRVGVLLIGVVPVVILAIGAVITFRRRSK